MEKELQNLRLEVERLRKELADLKKAIVKGALCQK